MEDRRAWSKLSLINSSAVSSTLVSFQFANQRKRYEISFWKELPVEQVKKWKRERKGKLILCST